MTNELQDIRMSYEGLVEAGRAAREYADGAQWTEGDLALQVEALPGDERPRDPETGAFIADEEKALRRYADDIDINYATLKRYRSTAKAWPHGAHVRTVASHRVYEVLAAQEDRFDLIRPGLTVREARKLVSDRTEGNAGRPGWLELTGRIGDDLAKAAKDTDALEAAVDRQPAERLQDKLAAYAEHARALAERFDAMREWREVA